MHSINSIISGKIPAGLFIHVHAQPVNLNYFGQDRKNPRAYFPVHGTGHSHPV